MESSEFPEQDRIMFSFGVFYVAGVREVALLVLFGKFQQVPYMHANVVRKRGLIRRFFPVTPNQLLATGLKTKCIC